MPRIDPLQLLKCLSVLLTPEGGILSRDEVPRLVSLMTKFSKKLVSKCVYVLILTNTETSLLELFMAEGGWTLIQTWLEDAMKTPNDDLVVEILNLLLMTPVDIERLKSNTIPRLVKTLTKRDENGRVKELSSLLVQKWLHIVKSTSQEAQTKAESENLSETNSVEVASEITVDHISMEQIEKSNEIVEHMEDSNKDAVSTGLFYKVSVRQGKQIISKLGSSENESEYNGLVSPRESRFDSSESGESQEEKSSEERRKDSSDKKSSKSSSKNSSSSKSGSHRDKEKQRSSSSSKNSSSGKDKDKSSSTSRDKDRRDKDKHRHNGLVKSSSKDKERRESKDSSRDKKEHHRDKDSKSSKHSERDSKDKQAERDKDTLSKIKPQTLDKLGRIPKKSSSSDKPKDGDKSKDSSKSKETDRPKENDKPKDDKEREQKRKGSMSIEVRKNSEERPKTVKIFNSKMRSTGLEEEVKPPPPRNAVKKPQSITALPSIPQKRPSPTREPPVIPEKKVKLELADRPIPERPGAIKLIPPKPKPVILQESDIFMDALTASATTKKEPKKRKRRPSVSKDIAGSTSPSSSPVKEESPTVTSPPGLKNIAAPNFYQDTLEANEEDTENKEVKEEKDSENLDVKTEVKEDISESTTDPSQTIAPNEDIELETKKPKLEGGLRGVLTYVKRKGPKRSVRWKPDEDLVEIRHFELDETERVNVTKTFMDMAKMEMTSEREALQMSRKVPNEDMMEAQIPWRFPYLADQPEMKVQPGSNSLEKDIQFAREKSILPILYFNKRTIPDSPEEPMLENHQMSDPVIIPLDDPECQEMDLRNTPWPEPKSTPPMENPVNIPPMFRNVPQQAFPNFPQMNPGNYQGMNRFQGPNGPGAPHMIEVPPMMDGPAFMGPQQGFPHQNMMNPNMMPHQNMVPPPEMMGQAPMDPSMFVPAGPMPGPDGFNPMMEDPSYGMGYTQPNMGMYHPQNDNNSNFEMNRGGPDIVRDERDSRRNNERGGRGGRGFRRGGGGNNGGWVRLNNGGSNRGGNWRGGGARGRPCKNIRNHGYCRNIDTCPFNHRI